MNLNQSKANNEVLECIKYLPKEEYDKIPKKVIKFLNENKDENYNFKYDLTKDINEQGFSKDARTIIIALYKLYFANKEEKTKLDEALMLNQQRLESQNGKNNDANMVDDHEFSTEGKMASKISKDEIKEAISDRKLNDIKDSLEIFIKEERER